MELLEEIAEQTGGRAFLAGSADALSQIFREVDNLEAVELRSSTDIRSTPMHRGLIYLGLILLCLNVFIRRVLFGEIM
jgi:Ca-activated chloride channel family protein